MELILLQALHSSKALCPSVFICAQMFAVNQGFVTSEAKGAHELGRRYPIVLCNNYSYFVL